MTEHELDTLLRDYGGAVRSVCRVILPGHPQDAEEAEADTFYKLWRGAHLPADETHRRRLVVRTARQCAIDRYRALLRRGETLPLDDRDDAELAVALESELETRELMAQLGVKRLVDLIGRTDLLKELEGFTAKQQKLELSKLLDLGSQSFDTFDTDWYSDQRAPGKTKSAREHMEWVYDTCVEYAHNFGKKPANLLLFGRPGLGKTHLSAAIAREVSGKGFSVVYDMAGHIFERFEAQKFGRDEAERDVERVLNCDLLILDDLGTEMTTTMVQSALYQIINGRLLSGRSTVISTNLMPEAIAQRYSGQIASRIEGEYQLLPFVGEDIRTLKKKRGL